MTPYNLLIVVALCVIVVTVGAVLVLGGLAQAQTFIAFVTPIAVSIVGVIVAAQNAQNHQENQARIADIEQKVNGK